MMPGLDDGDLLPEKGKKKPAYSMRRCRPAADTFYLPVL